MAQQIIRSIGSDGKEVLSNILDKDTGKLIEFKEVSEYYDGTSMSDDKMDIERYLYIKNNGKYYLRVLDNPDKFLEKDTILDMRNISNTEILLLKMGYYKGVKLNGYYSKGDTPAPIDYYISSTSVSDDGCSVFEVGDIKLEHIFIGVLNVAYYGIFPNNEFVNAKVNKLFEIWSGKGVDIKFNDGVYLVDSSLNAINLSTPNNTNKKGILLRDNLTITTSDGTLFKSTSNNVSSYTIICCHYANNVKINRLNIEGDRATHTGTSGEWGHGLFIVGSSNIEIDEVNVRNCWGDGFVLSGDGELSGGEAGTNNTNIKIGSIDSRNNRRNGVTISCVDTFICDKIISESNIGIDPQSGIDFEPDYNTDVLKNIRINSITTKDNKLYGLTFYLLKLDGTNDFVDITINSYESTNESSYHNGGGFDNHIKGQITIQKIISYNSPKMVFEKRSYFNAPDVYVGSLISYNSNSNNRADKYGSAIMVYIDSDEDIVASSKVNPNIIIDSVRTFNSNTNGVYTSAYVNNDKNVNDIIRNVQIKDVFCQKYNQSPIILNSNLDTLLPTSTLIKSTATSGANIITDIEQFKKFTNEGATSETLVVLYNTVNRNVVRVEVMDNQYIGVTNAESFGYIKGLENVTGTVFRSNVKGDFLDLKCIDKTNNIWQLVGGKGKWQSTVSGRVFNLDEESIMSNQPESTATDLDGLKSDFNELLFKLKNAYRMSNI